MTDKEINELISKETGRYPKENMITIPKNKFNIGDNITLNFNTDSEDIAVIHDIYWCQTSRTWEYSIISNGFMGAHGINENIIKLI